MSLSYETGARSLRAWAPLLVCESHFVLPRSQCNFSPSQLSVARKENFDGVRSRHEEELKCVREISSVLRGKVVSDTEANVGTRFGLAAQVGLQRQECRFACMVEKMLSLCRESHRPSKF